MIEAEATQLPQPNCRPLHCAWLGPTNGGLAWLWRRINSEGCCPTPLEIQHYPAIDMERLRTIVEKGGVDRIILACNTRLDYPVREIEFLQRDCPDVPLAVACDSWWDGARRTGLGTVDHLSLPWYRWWDGWSVWFEGRAPELFGPCQLGVAPWAHTSGYARAFSDIQDAPPPQAETRGLIVGNCRQTCGAWSAVAERCGFHVATQAWQEFQHRWLAGELDAGVQWILWDDSCLNTGGPQSLPNPALENFFRQMRQTLPSVWLIAALSLPRADEWQPMTLAERREMIVKPDSGHALTRLLLHIRSDGRQKKQ